MEVETFTHSEDSPSMVAAVALAASAVSAPGDEATRWRTFCTSEESSGLPLPEEGCAVAPPPAAGGSATAGLQFDLPEPEEGQGLGPKTSAKLVDTTDAYAVKTRHRRTLRDREGDPLAHVKSLELLAVKTRKAAAAKANALAKKQRRATRRAQAAPSDLPSEDEEDKDEEMDAPGALPNSLPSPANGDMPSGGPAPDDAGAYDFDRDFRL
eukprot:GHVT01094809.1.p1 GENE.GHVT01094809.1~~GHVT01094809.1.p1  ORF type:complete len:247 (-),score=81.23 GHVT01094809.1:747-1379(-)